eukprot:10527824-Lingulodinium_polyedra.AAC.1
MEGPKALGFRSCVAEIRATRYLVEFLSLWFSRAIKQWSGDGRAMVGQRRAVFLAATGPYIVVGAKTNRFCKEAQHTPMTQ